MKKFLFGFIVALLFSSAASAQVVQSGSVTPNQAVCWTSNGVIKTCGTSAESPLSSLGVTNNNGEGICINSATQTAAGRNRLCFVASTTGAAKITLQNYGTATAQSLEFVINGTVVTLPTGGGGAVPSLTIPVLVDQPICAQTVDGIIKGCTLGTAGQILVAQSASTSPLLKTLSGDVGAISAAGAVTLAGVNGVTFPASPSVGSAPYVSSTNTVTYGAVPVTGGGTGAATLAANGALVGNGTSPVTSVTTASVGLCLLSNGSSPPSWGGCASGSGSAAGPNTSIQFNNFTALAGSANLTWVSPALTIGVNATATGQLVLANGGAAGTSVTIQNLLSTTAYNFNLPTTAGSSGQPLISGGGGASSMSFGTLQVTGGGTACSAAAGTCLDNITNFSSTGFINRTGAGTYSFSTIIGLSNGGTGASLTASNGGLVYSNASAMAILAGTATANQIPLSGSSSAPSWSTATYPATTTANQLLYSSATNTIGGLATANSGVLITSAGGVPSISSTLPAAVQANITAVGTIASGTWNGSVIALAFGGTNANLTASNGGIYYSTATATAILAGTATANLPLLSGSSTAPTWGTVSYPASGISGGVAYFSSTTALASSAVLTANQIMVGGGAGAAPTTFACATATTVVHGGTPPTCSQIVAGDVTTNTLTNATLSQVAGVTLKGNPTGSTANASDFTINGLTAKGTPDANNDQLLLWDSVALTFKKVTPGAIASSATAGVTSIAGNTGAFTLAGLLTNSTNALQVIAAVKSDQTAATSTTVAVTPGVQQYHPSAAKAWGFISYSGPTPTLSNSFNVTSVSAGATGVLNVTLTVGFSTTKYSCFTNASNSVSNTGPSNAVNISSTTTFAVNHLESGTPQNPFDLQFVCFGTQ